MVRLPLRSFQRLEAMEQEDAGCVSCFRGGPVLVAAKKGEPTKIRWLGKFKKNEAETCWVAKKRGEKRNVSLGWIQRPGRVVQADTFWAGLSWWASVLEWLQRESKNTCWQLVGVESKGSLKETHHVLVSPIFFSSVNASMLRYIHSTNTTNDITSITIIAVARIIMVCLFIA